MIKHLLHGRVDLLKAQHIKAEPLLLSPYPMLKGDTGHAYLGLEPKLIDSTDEEKSQELHQPGDEELNEMD